MELLGKVPEHWEVRRLKYAVSFTGGGTPSKTNASFWRGRIPWVSPKDMTRNRLSDTADHITEAAVAASAASIVAAGAVLVVVRSGILRRKIPVAINTVPMAVNQDMKAMRPRKGIMSEYLRGLIQGNQSFWLSEWTKQGATVESIEHRLLANSRIPIPPPSEQTAIARFLDAADRRIRRYIRAKERLVELLEERKRALIHEAVTGRIDVRTSQPYPAHKDSGVEWLGKVPEHWVRCRLRNVVSEVTTGSRGWSSYAADDGPLFVRVANLSRGSLELRLEDAVRLDLPATSEAARTRIAEGDLLLSVTAYIGSVGVAPEGLGEAYVSQHVARCRPSPAVASKWLGYVLLSSLGQTYGQTRLYGGTKDGLSLDDVRNYPILLPSRGEQRGLVRWIERRLSLLGELRDATESQIELLREYRTRLIADVVTGKLDVREASARLPGADPLAGDRDRTDTIPTESNLHSTAHDTLKEAVP